MEEEEEEVVQAEGEVEEGATGFTQESEAPLRKKAMRTPQSKLVLALPWKTLERCTRGTQRPHSGSEDDSRGRSCTGTTQGRR